ncbi:hypothetical protein DFJ74DRAFT_733833 [Hyaloraphidium curvatum]|nr:hypothetical protein DFJ74DRAFT_733833 [Hyaloraphidium curvatum]
MEEARVLRTRCVRPSEGEPCERCQRLRKVCRLQDTTLTRRKREELRKAERARNEDGEKSPPGSRAKRRSSGTPVRSSSEASVDNASALAVMMDYECPFKEGQGAPALTASPGYSPTDSADGRDNYFFSLPARRQSSAATLLLSPGLPQFSNSITLSSTLSSGDQIVPFGALPDAIVAASSNILQPPSPLDLYLDMLPSCLAAYFDYYNKRNPIVHRATFLRAFVDAGSPRIYGPNAPRALLFALAAAGSINAEFPGLQDAQRVRAGREFANRARELVLAGYFDRPAYARSITGLEAVLVLLVLSGYYVPQGLAARMFPMLQRMVALLAEVCVDGPGATVGGADGDPPADATEWVLREMKTRAFVFVSTTDCLQAPTAGRLPLYPYFRHPIVFPAHDGFYEMDDEEEAFALLHSSPDRPARARFDGFRELQHAHIAAARRAELVRRLVSPALEGRAFVGTLFFFQAFIAGIKARQRLLAAENKLRVLQLALQDPALDTPPEALYRRLELQITALYADAWSAIPSVGISLGAGNPWPFLRAWPSFFSARGHAHSFLAVAITLSNYPLEGYLSGDPSSAPEAFFASPYFLSVLRAASVAVGLMRGQLADDPGLRWAHVVELATALRTGYVLLGAARAVGVRGAHTDPLGYAEDIKTVVRVMDSLGRAFKPLGTRFARDFRRAVLAAGIDPDAPPPAEEEDDEQVLQPMPEPGAAQHPVAPGDVTVPAAFARMAMSGSQAFKPWVK